MKICVAQTKPFRGDIESNIRDHKRSIDLAVANRADIIIFPELSLTGYEPSLANKLATDKDDNRFAIFQSISDNKKIIIGVGMPTRKDKGICISMILFHPNKERQVYSKKYLHSDEEAFFIGGQNAITSIRDTDVALAICYDLSIPEHSENAFKNGSKIYIASVAKTASGVEKAMKTLSGIASKYSMTVLLSNSVGLCEDGLCAGRSAVWSNKAALLGQLNDSDEGILILDTDTQELIKQTF